jgi:hypothetical protein
VLSHVLRGELAKDLAAYGAVVADFGGGLNQFSGVVPHRFSFVAQFLIPGQRMAQRR